MRRPGPSRQQGFGLLLMVVLMSMVTLMFVTGYSGLLTQQAANSLKASQQKYLLQSAQSLGAVWDTHALTLDNPVSGNSVTAADIYRLAGIAPRYGMQLAVSNVLTLSPEGIPYRNAVVYLPTETDTVNPPNLAHFLATGQFISCMNGPTDCDERQFKVFSSAELERRFYNETHYRLQQVAAKAQAYFKARMLQDPERAIDINYFRRPAGVCSSTSQDIGCIDAYVELRHQWAATVFGLAAEELETAWGNPIEVSNLQDSSTAATPFSMSFRARMPNGTYMTVRAVQQI